MGRPKGQKNTKPYKRLSAEEQVALIAEYAAGVKQMDLAAKYEVSQGAVSQLLRKRGVQMRSNTEAQPPTFDVDEAVRLWTTGQGTTYEVAEVMGVSQSVIAAHLKRRGVSKREGLVLRARGVRRRRSRA